MHVSKEQAAFRVQLFFVVLFTAVIFGLCLLCEGGIGATVYWIVLPVCLFFTPRTWLRDIETVWLSWWDMDRKNTRRLLLTVLPATVIFSFAAYLYAFANEFFNHDSILSAAYSIDVTGEFSIGRPMRTLLDRLAGTVPQPWLLGMLFMLWMFLASVLAVRVLHIQSTAGRVLLCGLLCTNTSLSNLFAHYTWCVVFSFALLTIIAAAWLFTQCRHGEILGIYFIVLSMMTYQAYFIAGVAFCFFAVIRMLACNENAKSVVLRGVRYLVLLAAGFLLYYLVWSVLCRVYGVEKARQSELTISFGLKYFLIWILGSIPHFFFSQLNLFGSQAGFRDFLERVFRVFHLEGLVDRVAQAHQLSSGELLDRVVKMFSPGDFLGAVTTAVKLLVMVMILFWLFCWLKDKRLAKSNKILLALSVCALPVVLDLSFVLFAIGNQTLININMGFLGVFLLLCLTCPAPAAPFPRRYRAAAVLLAAALLWQNIVYSNSIYIKMDLNKDATLSLITRVIERVEQTEGYVPGETPVAFSGGHLFDNHFLSRGRAGYEWFTNMDTGAAFNNYSISGPPHVRTYIQNYLNYPMNVVDPPDSEEIADMPMFPLDGSIQWIDGVIVVKIS